MLIKLIKTGLFVAGIFFVLMGTLWLGASNTLMTEFAIEPVGLLGLNTVRADFGAFFLCLGLFTLGSTRHWRHAETLCYCCALLMIVAALGRVLGMVFDGLDPLMIPPFIVEVILAGVYLTLGQHWQKNRQTRRDTLS